MQGRGGYAEVTQRIRGGMQKKEMVLRLCVCFYFASLREPLRFELKKFYILITHQYHPVVGEESVFRGMRQGYFSFFGRYTDQPTAMNSRKDNKISSPKKIEIRNINVEGADLLTEIIQNMNAVVENKKEVEISRMY